MEADAFGFLRRKSPPRLGNTSGSFAASVKMLPSSIAAKSSAPSEQFEDSPDPDPALSEFADSELEVLLSKLFGMPRSLREILDAPEP